MTDCIADTDSVTIPKHTGAAVGALALALELPMLWTLFIVHDSVRFLTALALLAPARIWGLPVSRLL